MTASRIVLIRYDEIGLKGKNRQFFESALLKNIKEQLKGMEGLRYSTPRGRIFIVLESDQIDTCLRNLARVPGIASMSSGVEVEPDADIIAQMGIDWIAPLLEQKSDLPFCVKTQRSNKKFPISSPDFNYEVGSRIMKQLHDKGLRVDLTHPEFELEVEIGHERTVAFYNRVPGLGGLPVGSSGQVLTLLSGGIDSPVAAFNIIKRGCRSHFIFFDNQAFLGRGGYDKVLRLAKKLNRFQGQGILYVVPFGDLQVSIRDHCNPSNRVVLYRRMMYRIAQELAQRKGYLGLVTGESIGQVASQTLENLAAVSGLCTTSVFRPLIGTDKVDIVQQAKRIETYEISIEPQPDCCSVFMPPRPVTRSKIPDLERDETRYPWKPLMEKALGDIERIELGKVV